MDWESTNPEGRRVDNVKDVKMYGKLRIQGKPVQCETLHPQEVRDGGKITFSYDIEWKSSPVSRRLRLRLCRRRLFLLFPHLYVCVFVVVQIQWVSRWDSYLKMEGSQVHWFSIVNSFMVVCFLSGIIFVILLKTVRRDLSQYEEMLTEKGEDIKEDSGWKLVSGDVFRPPPMVLSLVSIGRHIFLASFFFWYFV